MNQRRILLLLVLGLGYCASLGAAPNPLMEVTSPRHDAVVREREITLSGRASGMARLLVDGAEVRIEEGRFSAGPYELAEGTRAFLLRAESEDGEVREWVHRVERDSRAPRIAVTWPRSNAHLRRASVELTGTVADRHLEEIRVAGELAEVESGRFRHALTLIEGWQELELRAVDAVGNETALTLRLFCDLTPPALSIEDAASGTALRDGALFASEVRLRAGASEGETRATVDGRPWDLSRPIVAEGAHTVELVAVDAAGNETRRRASFVIDRTAPSFRALPADGAEVAGGGMTLEGRVEGASTIEVGEVAVPVDDDGRFRMPVSLEEGSQSISVVARDAAGNRAARTITVKSDTVAPVVTIASPADGAVVGSSPITVSGTAEDEALSEVRLGAQIATLDGSSFSLTSIALTEGPNTLTVEAEDVAGNVGTTSVTVELDTVAPVVEVQVDGAPLSEGAVFPGSITPQILTTDATAVTVDATLDGVAYVSGTTIETPGAHSLTVTATDAAGNAATPLSRTFETHQAPPTFQSVAPADGTLTAAATQVLSGQVTGAAGLTVGGVAVPLLADGAFVTDPVTLAEGANLLTLVATASGGLSTTVEHSIVRDSTPPTLSVSAPAEGFLVAGAAVDVSGTVTDAHAVSVTVNGVAGAVSGSAFLARQVPLTLGDNVLLVRAQDAAGNLREVSRTAVSDTEAPVVTFTDPAASGGVVPGPTLAVEGTAIDPHLDRVLLNGVLASTDPQGAWSVTVPLQEGENTLNAEAFDTLGHRGEAILFIERDSAAPEVSITEPAEGWATTETTVDVRGTVANEAGVTVTVNGLAATVATGTFEALAVPLAGGENVVIARASDPLGNEGVDSLSVVRDNEPPSFLVSDPGDGALALAASSVFVLSFSEPLAPPAAGAYQLEADDGAGGFSPLPTTATVEAEDLRIVPGSPLPTQTALRLVLTAQLSDPAGNPLANPTTLLFSTTDTQAPATPQLSPPTAVLCATTVTVTGTSEPDSRVVASGGATPAETLASTSGDFTLVVELLPGLNVLSLVAVDGGGNPSEATTAEVVKDCEEPRITGASRNGDDFRVAFDEPINGATAPGALSLSGDAGAIPGTVSAAGAVVTFTPSAALPASDLLLEVSVRVADLAGNTLGFPYSHLFEQALGESFFSGTVIDDATGRPLSGVKVTVTATDGVATPAPRPELTTDDTGRFVLTAAAGTHDVTCARPGYAPVFRIVTTTAGAGTEVFDPRLTPVEASQVVGAAGGGINAGGGVDLTVPAGALPVDAELRVTALSEQGLPALLPYGWSPRAAAWIDVAPGDTLAVAGTLRLPVASPEGQLLTTATLDLATLQWHAVATQAVAGGAVVLTDAVTGTGAYAVLERDDGIADPSPGEVLASAAPPSSELVVAANLTFDPELVLPNQRSRVTVSYQTPVDVASGLPLTLEIREQLELLDGTQRNEAPYRADLVLYRDPAGDSASTFWLEPSAAARSLPVRLGSEVVVVETYADEGVRGNVLGPAGGTVVSDEGDAFVVPSGALLGPTAVVIHRRAAADLPLAAPRGAVIDGVVELELETPLALAGTLSFFQSPPPAAGELGVLLGLVELDGAPRWRALAAIQPNATGWTTTTGDGLPWPGVTEAGMVAFARYDQPHGYAWGVITGVSGSPVAAAVVSSTAVDWIQLSDAQGRYVLPLPADGQTVTLAFDNPATGNARQAQVVVTSSGEQVELGTTLQIVAPSVISVTPADGDAGVPLGVEPTIDFSEPVDPATLAAGIALLRDGVAQAAQFTVQDTLVRVLPAAPLQPESDYTLVVGLGVKDLQGYSLVSQVSASFQTATIVLPESIEPRRLRVVTPDPTTGLAQVFGLPGAVPGEVTLLVENTSRPVATVSVAAAQDGSFALEIEAELGDRLQMTVFLEGTTAPVFWLPPFLSTDLRSAYVGPRAESFTTVDGVTLTLTADTFDAPTWLRVETRAVADSPLPAPELMTAVAAFSLDLGGATARHPLELRLPASAGVGTGPHLLNRFVSVLGKQGYMMHDLLALEDGDFVSSMAASVLPSQVAGASVEAVSAGLESAPEKAGGSVPEDYVTGLVVGGDYQIVAMPSAFSFLVMPTPEDELMLLSNAFDPDVPMVALNTDYLRPFQGNGLVLPSRPNAEVELTVIDLTTGYELFRDILPASPDPLVELPPDLFGDDQPPVLLSAAPLGVHLLKTAAEGVIVVDSRLFFEVSGTTLSITGAAGATVSGGRVFLLNLDAFTSEPSYSAEGNGSFLIEQQIVRGHRYLLGLEGRVHTQDEIILELNEALPADATGIQVRNRKSQQLLDLTPTPRGTRATQVLAPASRWAVGDYQLEITTALSDGAGNHWPQRFEVWFSVTGSSVADSLATGSVQDVATLGSLLFVATLENGLQVVDASDPRQLRNYLPENLSFTFPLLEATRGVAVDPHGRVYVTGGGAGTFGQLKIIDPQAIDLPAITADPANLDAAFRGSTLLSDPVTGADTILPAGFPRRLAVMSRDESTTWTFDPENPPEGMSFEPSSPPSSSDYLLTIAISGDHPEREGLPVTLRNRSRGSWYRVDAAADGGAVFRVVVDQGNPVANLFGDIRVRPGEGLELLSNIEAVAYVTLDGVGLASVDANAFYGEDVTEDFDDPLIASQVVRYHLGYPVPPTVCDPDVVTVDNTPLDVAALLDTNNLHPLAIPTLIHRYGLGILEAPSLAAPTDLEPLADRCAAIAGDAAMGGMATLQAYGIDLDGKDGIQPDEIRDYVVVTNSSVENGETPTGWVMIFDLTDRAQPRLVGQIEMPRPVATIAADRAGRRLYVAALGFGIYVVDFDLPPSLQRIDADEDGIDDRVVETITVADESVTRLALAPELGMIFAGGQNVGISSIAVTPPELQVVAADSGPLRSVARVAPFGVPTALAGDGNQHPGVVRIEAQLPGGLADGLGELRLDLVSEGPGGFEIDGAGDPEQIADLPPTSYRDLRLRRLSDRPYEEGYNHFVSDPILLVADLRASAHYDLTTEEEVVCNRCVMTPGVYSAAQLSSGAGLHAELLSGHWLGVRFPSAFRTATAELYGPIALDRAELQIPSVPWDISPSIRQEPRLNPSYGSGDVVPGTLLHSGEMTVTETDLGLRGRGMDFAFTRTYRNQIVGAGPLGPGWDHIYRMRLRELPNGDVELFDGRGRRELFPLHNPGAGVYGLPDGAYLQLNRHQTGWNVVDPSDTLYRFDRFGRLESISDSIKTAPEVGTAIELSYDRHSRLIQAEAHGRWLRFEYDDAGRLERVRDFSGREFEYGYDADGLLEEASTPPVVTFEPPATTANAPLATHYTYQQIQGASCAAESRCLGERLNRRNNLTTLTDPKGQTWLQLTWEDKAFDAREEEVTTQRWGSDSVLIDYANRHATDRKVTDRRGFDRLYFHLTTGQPLIVEDPLGDGTVWDYDSQGATTQVQLPSGRRLVYELDADHHDKRLRGNVVKAREEPADPPLSGETMEPLETAFDYGPANRLSLIDPPEGLSTTIGLTATGLPVSISRGAIVTSYQYNDFGETVEAINGNGERTVYEYFDQGSKQGLLQRMIVDPDGLALVTSYDYDERGNTVEITNPRGVRHQFVYNELDWLIEEKWAILTSGGLEPVGHRIRYSHDRNGNVTQVERLFGETLDTWTRTQTDYGLLNEVLETRQEVTAGEADWITERLAYDENLNPVEHLGPDGQVTRFEYDERNQLTARVQEIAPEDPDNLRETFAYNALGQLEQRTDANGETWMIHYDGFDRPREWINPLGHRTELAYNMNGQPLWTKAFGADGQLLEKRGQTYDLWQRPVNERLWLWEYSPPEPGEEPPQDPPEDAVEIFTTKFYDSASQIIRFRDPLDRLTHYGYDDAGRLNRIEDAAGNVIDLDLDANGNPWRQTLKEQTPGGVETIQTTASFDAFDRQTSMTDALGHTTTSHYDVRGNLLRVVDAEGNFTSYAYDGLDRRTRETRPEGIEVSYDYDASSRLVAYTDALGQVTSSSYDVFDRLTSVSYADGTAELYEYDANGNPTQTTQANGTVINQTFDAVSRLVSRLIIPALGVLGPTAETFAYDDLDRLISAQSGVVTQRSYDSLSRALTETSGSHTLTYGYDAAGTRVSVGYPSGRQLTLTPDALQRPQSVQWQGTETVTKAAYGFQGVDRLATREIGQNVLGTYEYDDAGRLKQQSYVDAFGSTVFGERTAWTPRGLKASQSRSDLNDQSLHFTYDGAGRVVEAERTIDLELPFALGSVDGTPGHFGFTYDAAQNLTAMSTALVCEDTGVELPLDGSGRNRPGMVGNVALAWNANGNLASKDDLSFFYDYRDRLTEVRQGATIVASYTYDAFNRRVERTLGAVIEETVWDGWQPIETYRNNQLASRRTYGLGIDEAVSFEHDLDGDGTLDDEYLPFYDETGNLVLVTDPSGHPIERYTYSPFGEQWIYVDSTPPSIEQVRVVDGAIWVEMSEEIALDALEAAIASGSLDLVHLSRSDDITLRVTQPVTSGRQARRRFVLDAVPGSEDAWPVAGEDVELTIPAAALKDHFANFATAGFPAQTLTWPASELLVSDTAPPRLEEVCVKSGGILDMQLTEELDLSEVATRFTLDGQPITWIPGADGYTLRSEVALETGSHFLSLATGPLDLSGKSLTAAFTKTFDIPESDPEQKLFDAPYPGLTEASTVANVYGFHGLPRDPETGWIYVRNRYYDPEIGRFITTDPMGYVDGPSMYQFALNNPANYGDPTGELAIADNLIGGAVSVVVGIGVTCVLDKCSQYSLSDAAIDFGLGFATSGLSALGQLKHLRQGFQGVARFGARAGIEIGLDVVAEATRQTIRNPEDELSFGQLAEGGLANFVIGEAGALAGGGWSRLRSGSRKTRAVDLSGVGDGGGALRVKTGIHAGSATAGGGGIVPRGTQRLLGPGTTYGAKIEGQLAKRGWTKRLVQSSIDDPVRTVATRDTRYLPGGGRLDDPATAHYNRRGGYVVRNDRTGDIVQVSDRTDAAWRAPWD